MQVIQYWISPNENNYLIFLVFSICIIASSCSIIQPHPGNKQVRLIFYNEINLIADNSYNCEYLTTLVSSDGHWYNYLFISNADLSNGALNDMYNKANAIDANVIYVNSNIDFATSVTLLGQAYKCSENDDQQQRQQRY